MTYELYSESKSNNEELEERGIGRGCKSQTRAGARISIYILGAGEPIESDIAHFGN